MKTRLISATLALLCTSYSLPGTAGEQHAHHPGHWSYRAPTDPAHWDKLQPDFVGCKAGHEQSPINIHAAAKVGLAPLSFDYAPTKATVANTGHTIQVNLQQGNTVKLASGDYQLLQFHFHTPSEEKIDGKSYPLEAHLVHRNAEGKLAVVAVLFKQGKENPLLTKVFASMPTHPDDKAELSDAVNPADLLPSRQGYYAYMGSLTTPPCTEGVHWEVMKQPLEVSKAQLAMFKKLYPMNARPVQPLNGRTLQSSQ